MRSLLQDLRYGLRLFVRSPGFALAAVLTLALGIGMTGAIFSVLDMLLLRKLPLEGVAAPEDLVLLWGENQPQGQSKRPASVDMLVDLQRTRSFTAVSGGYQTNPSLSGGRAPVRLEAWRTSPSFFQVLGVQPALGRVFLSGEERPGQDRVAILTNRFWHQEFAADPDVLKRTLRLDGIEHRIVGVMPRTFLMPSPAIDVLLPLGAAPGQRGRDDRFLLVLGRLAPGVSREQAQTEMNVLSERLAGQYPDTERGWRVQIKPLLEELYDGGVLLMAVTLLLAVGLVLLLACANVGSLLLARALSRKREVAVRLALGAGRKRLIRQLLTESILLALCGGALGLGIALAGARLIGRFTTSPLLSMVGEVGVDAWLLTFLLGASLLSAVVCGLFPALQASRPDLTRSLKEGGKAGLGRESRRALDSIVVGEIALALVLLMGAGLMMRTIQTWRDIDVGYDPSGLLTLRLDLPEARYGEPHQVRAFATRLEERLEALPGVEGVLLAGKFPTDEDKPERPLEIEGSPATHEERPFGQVVTVSAGALEALRLPLREGRSLEDRDSAGAPLAMVVSQTLAERLWPGESAVGRRIRFGNEPGEAGWRTVVGVVGPVEHYNVHIGPMPLLFVPLAQQPERTLSVALRTAADNPLSLAPQVRRILLEMDPDLPADELRTMDDVINDHFVGLRTITNLLSLFGLVALLLAALGIYGVLTYAVGQRAHEIGVRMALGALPRDVLRMILLQAGRLALVGIALGVLGSIGLTRLMSSLLHGVGALDPLTFGSVALTLLLVALLSSYLPGRRATRIEPATVLKT
jgi:putative ABC transport system permease protein